MEQFDNAYHEAGHSVFAYFLNIKFLKVSLSDDSDIGGCIEYDACQLELERLGCKECKTRIIQEIWAKAAVSGPLSEKKFCPSSEWEMHGEKDFSDATQKLALLFLHPDEADAYLNWVKTTVLNLLNDRIIEESIKHVAARLSENRVLSYEEVSNICGSVRDSRNTSFSARLRDVRASKHNQ